jgi:hypothetical protein
MDTILAVASWLSLAYIYRSKLKVDISEVWIISLSILIIASFVIILAVDFKSLLYVKVLLILLGFIELYKNQQNEDIPLKMLIFTGILFILIAFLITRQESYSYIFNWDDFSHWARSVKLLVLDNGYGDFYFSQVLFPTYGPGSATWHAFFQDWNIIDESTLYFSQILWIFSLLICVYGISLNYVTDSFQKVLILVILAGLGNTITPYGHNLQVDILIGLSLASAYLIYNYSKSSPRQKLVNSAMILFTIVLTKPIGLVALLQFSFLNLISNGFKRVEIARNIAIVALASFGAIIWALYISEIVPHSGNNKVIGYETLLRLAWQAEVFYDYFVIKLFYFSIIEKVHVVIYGGLLYSIVIYINCHSAKLLKIVFLSIIVYLAFLLLAYTFYFNGNGSNSGEAASLGSINRYFSVQFYFLIPVMLIETLKLHGNKVNYSLISLIFLVISFYFTKVLFILPIVLVIMMVLPQYSPKTISNKVIILLAISISVTLYYSSNLILKKVFPSTEYVSNAKRLKEVVGLLHGSDGDKTTIVWDDFDTYSRLGVQYYSDYRYRGYKIINTEEYNKISINRHKESDFQKKVIFK